MLNIDPIMCIPGALTELISRHEARVRSVVNDRQMTITVDQMGTGRLLWQVKVLARATAPIWHISEYTDVAELRQHGIASEFCDRLIQQAEDCEITFITAHCSPESATLFVQMFGAVRAGDLPQEQRVQIFGRDALEDGSVGWDISSSLAIFIRCHRLDASRR